MRLIKYFIFLYAPLICPFLMENDILQKEQKIINFVDEFFAFINQHSIAESCHEYFFNARWHLGHHSLFLFDKQGFCYFFGLEEPHLWRTISAKLDIYKNNIISEALKGPQWVSFEWNNEIIHAYIKPFQKEGETFLLGGAYYIEDAEYYIIKMTQNIVKSINKYGLEITSRMVSDPYGAFVKGNLYSVVFEPNGKIIAHGEDRSYINQNIHSVAPKDFVRLFDQFVKSNLEFQWFNYRFQRAQKTAYLKKFVDPLSNKLYIVGTSFPEYLNLHTMHTFVRRAIAYIGAEGQERAYIEFNHREGEFNRGGMRITVYSPAGVVLASGEHHDYIGKNMMNVEVNGTYPLQDLLHRAMNYGRVWELQRAKNSVKLVYAEKMIAPNREVLILTTSFWPLDAKQIMESMVKAAVSLLETTKVERAFELFNDRSSLFLLGEHYISVIGENSAYIVRGPYHKNSIWRQWKSLDDSGKVISKSIFNLADQGGGWMSYKQYGIPFTLYVEPYTAPSGARLFVFSGPNAID